jgi:4-carboxymuconolactone decarboxylase
MTQDNYAALEEAGVTGRDAVLAGTPRPTAKPETGSFSDFADKVIFGDIWQRPGLSMRDRRLITIALLGINGDPRTQALHIRGALHSGDLSPEELEAFLLHFGVYAGFPRASGLQQVLQEEIRTYRDAGS